jgi:glycerol uptake facilitator-like aquaporin
MAEKLAGGNLAIALLGNTIPTGAILVVLILALGPVSGAHFNPAVSAVMGLTRALTWPRSRPMRPRSLPGAASARWPRTGCSSCRSCNSAAKARTGPSQWFAEFVATFGLILTILCVARRRVEAIPVAVGLYITAAYWFTASTSFANPAVTAARALTDTFAGIAPNHVLPFVLAQLIGAAAGLGVARWLDGEPAAASSHAVRDA